MHQKSKKPKRAYIELIGQLNVEQKKNEVTRNVHKDKRTIK